MPHSFTPFKKTNNPVNNEVVLSFEMQRQFVCLVELLMTIDKRNTKKNKRASGTSKKKAKINLDQYEDMGLFIYKLILFLLIATLSLILSKYNAKVTLQ